jgi:hypothetical protein
MNLFWFVPLLYRSFTTSCWLLQCDQSCNAQKKVWIIMNYKLVRFHCNNEFKWQKLIVCCMLWIRCQNMTEYTRPTNIDQVHEIIILGFMWRNAGMGFLNRLPNHTSCTGKAVCTYFTHCLILCDCEAIAYLRFHYLASSLWNQATIMMAS